MFKLTVVGLFFALIAATTGEPDIDSSLHDDRLRLDGRLGNRCLWQCDKLFNRDMPGKNCSAKTNNLTNCVCDHLLVRSKFPQCIVSICGNRDGILTSAYVNEQIVFPGNLTAFVAIGIWAACAQLRSRGDLSFVEIPLELPSGEVIQSWWPTTSDEELNSVLYTRDGDNRLAIPFWMRRFLLPIWRQESLPSSLSYRPPLGSENVKSPRSAADLLDYRSIFSVHFFAIVAYAHLLHMNSESEGYWIEAVQVILFLILPGLPTIQLVNSFLKVIFKSAWSSGFRYNASALCGQYVFERRTTSNYRARLIDLSTHELEEKKQSYLSGQFWGRLAAILINLCLVAARFVAYVCRLRATLPGPDHTAIYISATGIDHRLGWVAFGGLVSTFITLLRHVANVEWSINPNLHLPRRSTFDWKMEIWLEIIAAAIGQSMLTRLTNRISTSILLFRVLDAQLGRYIFTALSLLVLFCIQYRNPLMSGMQRRSSGVRRILLALFLIISALYIATVVFLQIFTDVEEIADIKLGWVFGWNYLWRVPEPTWWFML